MEKLIEANDACELTASSHRDCTGSQVLKHGDSFLLVDRMGEVGVPEPNEQGLYHLGTRHLSRWELLVAGARPMVLNSAMKEDNSLLVVQMTTPDLTLPDGTHLGHGTLHVFRSLHVQQGAFHERLQLTNYSRQPLELTVEYRFDADYQDIFEIRGAHRQHRGELLESESCPQGVRLGYRGLDGQLRHTELDFEGQIDDLDADRCIRSVRVGPGAEVSLQSTVRCSGGIPFFHLRNHTEAAADFQAKQANRTDVFTSNEQFNEWINRSMADLEMLVTETLYGNYPYAGVPWFATPFGRDGLITALQTVWLRPRLTKGVLSFLAATQATDLDPETEAEPGKIMHEMREGEMAALGEVPFRRYYGTVDATPLFVMLAGQYYQRTGDRDFIEFIWPNIHRAIDWIDHHGDVDGDGFIEYEVHNQRGLKHQCWKDSDDSIYHADGRDARGAIAVSEAQGYVYEAKLAAADLAELMNESGWAEKLRGEARQLKENFNAAFWVHSIDSFAIALDGDKRPCAVRNSNAGHLLYTGIVDDQYATQVCRALTEPRSFNGWGIRTIAEGEVRYNPMSYHNGSVWPHDTAIAVAGLSRYGFRQEAMQVMTGLFNASLFNELHRLPELFCGFDRLTGLGPTLYPVACSPQAWATGAVFMCLQAILGLSFAPTKPQIRFDHPRLPPLLDWVRIQNLRIDHGVVDLALRRHPRDVGMSVERKEGEIQTVVLG